ncbi:MAG: alpha/beta hydrolase family protein [Planctomycetota bacterium]
MNQPVRPTRSLSAVLLPTAASLTLFLTPFALANPLAAQGASKRPVTHDDYDNWTSLRSTTYSRDGRWMAYSISPRVGDGTLHVQEVDGDRRYEFPRGTSVSFSNDSKLAMFKIGKSYADERRKKLEKLYAKKEEKKASASSEEPEGLPPDVKKALSERGMTEAMAMRMMEERGSTIAEVRGFLGLPAVEKKAESKSATSKKKSEKSEAEKAAEKEAKALLKRVHVLDLATGDVAKLENVKNYRTVDDTDLLLIHFESEKKEAEDKKDAESSESPGFEPTQRGRRGRGRGRRGRGGNDDIAAAQEPQNPVKEAAAKKPKAPSEEQGKAKPETAGEQGPAKKEQGKTGEKAAEKAKKPEKPKDPLEKKRRDGSKLVIRDLSTGQDIAIENVRSFGTLADDKWLWYSVGTKKIEEGVQHGLFARELSSGITIDVLRGYSNVSGMTTDEADKRLVFTSDLRTFGKDEVEREVYLWTFDEKPARRLITKATAGVPDDFKISSRSLSFSRDGSVLMFSITPPKLEEMPKILKEDEVKLDLWHWQDGLIQPMQAKRSDSRKASLMAAYHMDVDRAVVLGTPSTPRVSLITDDGSRALMTDSSPYEKMVTWDGRYTDVYIVNTVDGSKTKIIEGLRGRASRSTGGRYITWFDPRDYDWHTYDVHSGETRNLTDGVPVAFDREKDDRPEPHGAHGTAGWTENDAEFLVYDEYDIWAISPETGDYRCVTDGLGRASGIRFRNSSVDLRPDAERDDNEKRRWLRNEMVLSATDTNTYAQGYYTDAITGASKPKKVVMRDASMGRVTRPENADRLFLTMSRFDMFPDVWTTDLSFGKGRKLTDGCQIMDDVRWGRAELVRWNSDDGTPLKGYLIKPDGFDPEKQYPMMVYFYEKSSNRLHSYVSPNIGTSPNAAYYVSNGYLWFVPDIVYRDGYPGESCEKCVVSGVQSLIAKGFVKKDSIGVAGHSWGGYQTAHLITRTDIFAAAESGAPVVNMFSAYGGIRWGTGMSRQFQYEQTQSRIGGTIWESPMRYWENSPLFYLDKANTPVLILHNDKDGAVPWYQGIEFFTAMRRLGKEAYLFNYNDEDHGLRKKQNQRDWTRRMAQFFDHHLKGAEASSWIRQGVPYHQRMEEKVPNAPSYREAVEAGMIQAADQTKAVEASAEARGEAAEAAGSRDRRN